MTRVTTIFLAAVIGLTTTFACGGPQRPKVAPNDEVTTRMNAADEAALEPSEEVLETAADGVRPDTPAPAPPASEP